MKCAPIKKKKAKPKSISGKRYQRKGKYIFYLGDLVEETHSCLRMKMTKKQQRAFITLYLRYAVAHILKGGQWTLPREFGNMVILKEEFNTMPKSKTIMDEFGFYYSLAIDSNLLEQVNYCFEANRAIVKIIQDVMKEHPEIQYRTQILAA